MTGTLIRDTEHTIDRLDVLDADRARPVVLLHIDGNLAAVVYAEAGGLWTAQRCDDGGWIGSRGRPAGRPTHHQRLGHIVDAMRRDDDLLGIPTRAEMAAYQN